MSESEVEKENNPLGPNPIDADKVAENPGLLPYAHTVGGAIIRPEDKGKIKGRAMAAMVQQTDKQLGQLYDQMIVLAEQANAIKRRVEVSENIYNAEISFDPIINHYYFLYQRKNEKYVLSMIGPKEWGSSSPYSIFVAKVLLMADHTWEIVEEGE